MSYEVDPKTLLFTTMKSHEARRLISDVENLVLHGTPVAGRDHFESWCKALKYEGTSAGLAMATSYPQRALLSYIYFLEDQERVR